MTDKFRIENDSMGDVKVPKGAYYGAQTQRAVENFPVSGLRMPRSFIRALGLLKKTAAAINRELGLLDETRADAIIQAAGEVREGAHDGQFVVDVFQTGSGTSTNMNANEVIANRAIEILGGSMGKKDPIHPNDHVNLSQSSNDVIPSAIHLAVTEEIEKRLRPALQMLLAALESKANAFDDIVKIGRTHLQDATPIRLGQEFSGYASMVKQGVERLDQIKPHIEELALGGTAVGTGLNAPRGFSERVIEELSEATGLSFREAENHFQAQGAMDTLVEVSSALKTMAVGLMKIANDLRWLSSGPRCGIGEITLPSVQPGSSIMPGKVNPVIPEAVCQVAAQVMGNDLTVAIGAQAGNFELNVMMPVMAHNLLQSITLLASVAQLFATRCIEGIEANRERCEQLVEESLAMVTALSPRIGYDRAAEIAKTAYERGKTVRELVEEEEVLPEEELQAILDPRRMTEPGKPS